MITSVRVMQAILSILDVGFAWNDPEQAIEDAKGHIDRFGLRSQGGSNAAF